MTLGSWVDPEWFSFFIMFTRYLRRRLLSAMCVYGVGLGTSGYYLGGLLSFSHFPTSLGIGRDSSPLVLFPFLMTLTISLFYNYLLSIHRSLGRVQQQVGSAFHYLSAPALLERSNAKLRRF